MQESHNSGSKQHDPSSDIEITGGKLLPLNEPSDSTISQSDSGVGDTGMDAKAEYIQLSEPHNAVITKDAVLVEDRDIFPNIVEPLPESNELPVENSQMEGERMKDAISGLREKEKLEVPSTAGDCEIDHTDGDQIHGVRDVIFEKSVKDKMVKFSSRPDASSISLFQLVEVLQNLNEDDFRFLFMSRESAQNVPPLNLLDAFDRVKEQLYLASLAKDVSSLQHAEESELQMELSREHRKLTDQITVANDSIHELGETNKILTDQLAQCRGEFQLVVSERDEFQKQLHISKGEVGELSGRINELQSEIEMSVRENASLSSELFDCRNLLATLQVQHDSLSGSLDLLSEDNKKLFEEKGNFVLQNEKLGEELAESKALLGSLQLENAKLLENFSSLSQEQSKFDAEKEHQICENEKLLAELADCKNVMEALQVENKKLNEVLINVTEEKKQLQDENQSSLGDTEKLALELKESKSLVEALQVEVSEARGHMTSLMEERKKLEEKNEYFLRETEKQTSQLVEYKNSVAGLQEECCKVEDDLKYASLRIENLTEENMHLKSSLQLHETVPKESHDQIKFPSQSKEAGYQLKDSCKSSFAPSNVIDDDGSIWFGIMKRHLEEGEEVVEQLEKAIEEMHSHSASLGRSTGKVAAPGVSKLIQAFEPTGHTDDHHSEELQSFENKTDADLYVLIKVQTKKLRALLKDLMLEAGNGYQFLEGQSSRMTLADLAAVELKSKYESLNEQIYYLEGKNVELMVFNETLTGCFQNAKEEEEALMVLNENLRKQEDYLKAENSQQRENIRIFQGKLSKLQHQLDEMRESFKGMGSYISNQVEALQKEVTDKGSIFDEEWNSITSQVFQTLGKLDVSVDMVSSSAQSRKDSGFSHMDLSSRTVASVDAAIEVIGELWVRVEAARSAHEAMSNTSGEVNEKLNCLRAEKDGAIRVLHEVYSNLKKLVKETPGCLQKPEFDTNIEKPVDPLQPGAFDSLLEPLQGFLGEMVQFEIINGELKSELADMTKVSEELNNRTLGSDFILKVVQVIEGVVALDGVEINIDEPVSCLESLISFLVQKYKEAAEDVRLSREEHTSKEDQVFNLQGQMDHLNFLLVQSENEITVLRESVRRAEEEVVAIRSQYQDKVAEFEQSEQRISSLREKLGIAVTKGKGLIVQRDSLKQSLAETSSELEKCSQDLQLKDARLHELEMKLRTYSEAGERMEALESELSYIRNSATALRESFLLKDSVIQRIEEILEDLELPEHFQVKDIIDKVDWLAKSVTGNSRPPTDWDQKSSVGGSYSDSGYGVVGGWKEDSQLNLGSSEELRRRFEELQSKFYGLAEQNEMLEQSLIERNNLVQLWEEILDKIDMPSHLRSVEAEDRIGWLVHALSEAQNQYDSLKQKVENFEAIVASKTAELEESHRRTSELEDAFKLVVSEKELISKNMESLAFEYEEMSRKAAQSDISNDDLQSKLSGLQEKLNQLLGTEERFHHLEGEIRRLQDLVKDVLQNSGMDDILCISDSTEYLEILLRKLIEKYTTLSSRKPFDSDSTLERVIEDSDLSREEKGESNVKSAEDTDVGVLSRKLEDALGDLRSLMEEREKFVATNQSLVHELEAVSTKSKEVQDLLSQEEHKSASLREKLNVAVRKGKSLVQQRDSMKQLIEELHVEVEQLKSEIVFQKNAISDYEEKITNLSMEQERISIVESENTILRDQLAAREHTLSMILNSLDEVDFGSNIGNPVEKIKRAGEQCLVLQSALTSSEQEVRKSKRAAELLLAELNEVQERNDGLQEELSMSLGELSELSNEKEAAEVAKREALARLEKLSSAHSEERKNQSAELMSLKSNVDQLREDLFAIGSSLNAILSKDLEILHNVGASMKVVLEPTDAKNHLTLHASLAPVGIISTKSENKVFGKEIGSIKENLNQHSRLIYDEAAYISEIVGTIHEEITSHKQHADSLKKEVMQLGSILKEKDSELSTLRRYNTMLFEACNGSVMEIETRRAQLVANSFASGSSGVNTTFRSSSGGNNFIEKIDQYSEDGIRSVIEKLFVTVKDIMSVQNDIAEVGQKDLKAAISNLQKELQEKDIQRDKICKELVSQIKEAEAVSKSYSQELQLAKSQITDLQRKVDLLEEERNSLKHRINELQDQEAAVIDLQHRVQELENMMSAKEQENEALMQALDEEEAQMEDLKNQIGVAEKVLLQKSKEIENLEVSRGKATKKLSVTVSKFDELHHLSESLLSEVENLQSQLQERDTEISFLRQEVTRCTNDALVASQMSSSRNSDEIHGFLTWLDGMISRVQAHNVQFDDAKVNQIHEYKDMLQKQLMSVISELEDLRAVAQTRDLMLKTEKDKVEQLVRKEEFLVNSLREKEFQLTMVRGVGDSAQITNSTSEITEIEPVANKWVVPGTAAPQVRSLRKSNNDQVAVAIDVDSDSGKLDEDDDDDKAHGFKSLTTSRIVPRFTRPVTNMIDGLWVSCDRALMRQPALRLGVIFYWAILHALLAAFVV